MYFRKSVSLVLIATQMSLGVVAASADPVAPQPSPELTLVQNVVALQGLNLSVADSQGQVQALMKSYLAQSADQGRQARFEQALVELGVYSPQQAQAFMNDAQAASARVVGANPANIEQAQISQEIARLASAHPAGAQFSASSVHCAGEVVGIAGVVTLLVGSSLWNYNPTCSTDIAYYRFVCNGSSCSDEPVYRTTCTNPTDHPDAKIGEEVSIAGGIVLAIGALLYFTTQNADGC